MFSDACALGTKHLRKQDMADHLTIQSVGPSVVAGNLDSAVNDNEALSAHVARATENIALAHDDCQCLPLFLTDMVYYTTASEITF